MSLKPQSAKKIIKALSTLGFKIVRKRGSHVVLKHADEGLSCSGSFGRRNRYRTA
jgi:predicted RNA binding protein YcfA (HicA-like mRNA interferase family)